MFFLQGAPAGRKARHEQWDVVVVGGGPSGLLVSEQLAAAHLSCLVLEAGPSRSRPLPGDPERFARAIKPLLEVDDLTWRYRVTGLPAQWRRVRAAGGRSLLWRGLCARPEARNLRDADQMGVPWPIGLDELGRLVRRVERILGVRVERLDRHLDEIAGRLGLEAQARRAAVSGDARRPLVPLDWERRASLISNAVATRVVVDRKGGVAAVEYVDLEKGEQRRLDTRAVVLCASPIETTRLLLEDRLRARLECPDLVGSGLVDHLVGSLLLVSPGPPPESAVPIERAAVVQRGASAQAAHRRDHRVGFTVEVRGPAPCAELGPEVLARAGLDRREAARWTYHAIEPVGDVPPHPARRVALDPEQRDALGRPIPVLHLAWGEDEPRLLRDMSETAASIAEALWTPGSRVVTLCDPMSQPLVSHEAGTCRVGRDPRLAPADSSGAVRGVRGLYVADASAMPTALDRPPTLALLALALHTADRIRHRARAGDL